MRAVVILAHCILNQSVVIHGWERAIGAFPFVKTLPSELNIVQLPCPEFMVLGPKRPPLEYADYANLTGFRQACDQLLRPVIAELNQYATNQVKVLGVIGIAESPNCAIRGQQGVFMQEFFKLCQLTQLEMPYLEVPVDYPDMTQIFMAQLSQFLEEK
ncbi:CD3072 family TudS-related putative desulfidase [Loigolactobacillus jiayinensis]|uniref:CD3072 family TudS-related putative desulfidase n=1 Tax=Loigolactobacillus jiayinensis TaxID=2486016 RepID=A0ABW1RKN9_9LACO|nr:CD3072 family TudS-related putative desulfidase [Loigolactobacillus jiayinensis]